MTDRNRKQRRGLIDKMMLPFKKAFMKYQIGYVQRQ